MKKLMIIGLLMTGIMHGSSSRENKSFLSRAWDTAGDIAFYPIGVICDGGAALLDKALDSSPTLQKCLETENKQKVFAATATSIILVSAVFAAPASLFTTTTTGTVVASTPTTSVDTLTETSRDIPTITEDLGLASTTIPQAPAKQNAVEQLMDLDLKRYRHERKLGGGPRPIIPHVPHPGNGRGHLNEQSFGFDPNELYHNYENNRN